MFDNSEIEELLNKLEDIEDEVLAASLLSEFNAKSKVLGQLLMNIDTSLSHDEWKKRCDIAKKELDSVLSKIKDY
ncbi:MAG: hypothetical protein COW01_11840 [Bdellovibrionales bacterium CG12_big_fil_rev_8_21_14_0_65_38_15]|nr:MAG: hypothetical protein COW79_01400 [Bdellovibrionales bacterium CG22_combo_CG10-13_8_21_14_all_38_13]PIQ54025.1 MAG: hypothetical protein COW01_11840 [Bdellovibrionales bacterium CG12_big_fil_rev_8_21_14_0_65_38_15]PIR28550.1 MAG: hypothetical protein COV38_14840 [Bdellovibrionales bacterium CG11_big_fil_rev_8_21_14_0_20_38_13]